MSKSTHLFNMFSDEESARAYFEAQRWPDGPVCPACGERARIWLDAKRGGFYRCNADLVMFTVRTGTIFERSKVALHKWSHAMHLLVTSCNDISSLQLHSRIGVTQKTAWFMLKRLREACGSDPIELASENDILETITRSVFAYQPADKAKWAKSVKKRKHAKDDDESHLSI